jgi:2-dehydro-3-deoxyphosphooctonate aldolase (KDO 8-P synthase)
VGLDAIFVEVHPTPDEAPCDGPSQLGYQDFERLLTEVRAIDRALG